MGMVTEFDVRLDDGRTLHAYDTAGGPDRPAVFWHHGTPNTGAPPEPLFPIAEQFGMRWVSFDRPSYGGSTPHPGRTIATVAADLVAVADALGLDRFAVAGHSGGGSHALGTAALLPDRVVGVVSIAGIAPYGVDGLDWFAGMAPAGQAALRSAVAGRAARIRHQEESGDEPPAFTDADWAILEGEWSWLGTVAQAGSAGGPDGQISDDLAYVTAWGCDPTRITAPILHLHGDADLVIPASHGAWIAEHCPTAELRQYAGEGHISILGHAAEGLEWLRGHAGGSMPHGRNG